MNKRDEITDFNKLKNQIRNGQVEQLYVITGEEDYLIDNLVMSLSTTLIPAGLESLDRVVLDAGFRTTKPLMDRLEEETALPPFASKRRLVIVRESGFFNGKAGGSKKGKNADSGADSDRSVRLTRLFEGLTDCVCLVFVETKIDRRQKKLIDAIDKYGVLARMERHKHAELVQWLQSTCDRKGIAIQRRAAESLVERCESSMRMIQSEIAKIILYCESTETVEVDYSLVEALCIPDIRANIFELIDTISAGSADRSLRQLDRLMARREPTTLIRFLLARHLKNLLIVQSCRSDADAASKAGVPPFVASRMRRQSRSLDPLILESMYIDCQENDRAVKTGRMPELLAMETLLVSACARFNNTTR